MDNENKQSAYLKLPKKRRKFVDEYVLDCNGTQAAIRAGYSARTAQEQSAQLLSNLMVKEAVDEKLAAIAKENELTVDWVIKRSMKLVDRCMQEEPVYDHEGNETGIFKFDSSGANGALKTLAKYLGMETTNHRHSGANGEPLIPSVDLSSLSMEELKTFLLLSKKVHGV